MTSTKSASRSTPQHHAQRELEALVSMDHSHGGDARCRELDRVLPQPLHLHPEASPIGDYKAEIANLRDVHTRVIHLVDDAATDREPEAGLPIAQPTISLLLLLQVGAIPGATGAGPALRRAAEPSVGRRAGISICGLFRNLQRKSTRTPSAASDGQRHAGKV